MILNPGFVKEVYDKELKKFTYARKIEPFILRNDSIETLLSLS